MQKKTLKILALVLLTLLVLVPMALWTTTEIVHAEETTSNTADTPVDTNTLTPGRYQLRLSATHPETGQVFTTTRSVQLMAASNGAKFGVYYPRDGGTRYGYINTYYDMNTRKDLVLTTMVRAIDAIKSRLTNSAVPDGGLYYICLEGNYQLTSADRNALMNWQRVAGNYTIVFYGGGYPGNNQKLYTLDVGSVMPLPQNPAGMDKASSFVFRNITLTSSSGTVAPIVANGSKLIIEPTVTLAVDGNDQPTVSVVGGGASNYNESTQQQDDPALESGNVIVTGNTYIELRASGTYKSVVASNSRTGAQSAGKATTVLNTPNQDLKIANLVGFDTMRITANTRVMLNGSFRANDWNGNARDGLFEIGNGGSLIIGSTENLTDEFRTIGAIDGIGANTPATVSIRKGNPLRLSDANPVRTSGKIPITLTMHSGIPAAGDVMLTFTHDNGAVKAQEAIFAGRLQSGIPGLALSARGKDIILVPANISVHTVQNPNQIYYFDSFASAFNNLDKLVDPSLDYVFTVRKENYTLLESDIQLIKNFTGTLNSLTVTSRFELTDSDIKNQNEQTGQTVTRKVLFAKNVAEELVLAPNATFTNGITIDGITFGEINSPNRLGIYASGHKLTMGEAVRFDVGLNKFPILFGGGSTQDLSNKDTHLIVKGGTYFAVFGGGYEKTAAVRNTRVEIGGNAQGIAVYGGGRAAPVKGNVHLTITAGSGGAPAGQRVKIVGGGNLVGELVLGGNVDVDGSVTIDISGGQSISGVDIIGHEAGTVKGKTTINVITSNSDPIPTGDKVNIYAGMDTGISNAGETEINITGGAFWGTISGGDKSTSNGSVPTSAVINLKGQVRVDDIRNFTELNIGTADTPASLIVSGLMDSTPYENDYNNKIGKLNLNNSVLTFDGTTNPSVGNLTLTGTRNQLVTYKNTTAGSSVPLNVTDITFNTDARLTVGATNNAAVGDEVLKLNSTSVTEDMVNGYLSSMVAQNPNLYKVGRKADDYKTIILAALGKMTAVQTEVTQNEADHQLNGIAKEVSKTLTFAFESRNEANELVVTPALTEAWLSDSEAPVKTGTKVTITPGIEGGQWTGRVTSNFDGWTFDTNRKKYYLHYYDTAGTVGTLELDVHSPNITTNITASRTGEGVYTFTAKVQEVLDQTDTMYKPSGLRDMGFSFQDAPTTTLGGSDFSIATTPMTGILKKNASTSDNLSYGLHQIEQISDTTSNQYGEHTYQVTLSLGAQNNLLQQYGQNFTAYLFVQDRLGNVRRIDIPVSEHKLDVSIPTRIGVLVVRGGATSKTIAPAAYLYNNGQKHFTGYFTGVTYENGNPLNFVPSIDNADKSNSMSINVVDPSWSWAPHFLPTPLAAVSQQTPINLGSTNDPNANNKIGLTFEAIYDPQLIQTTSQWSVFYLSYAFKPTT